MRMDTRADMDCFSLAIGSSQEPYDSDRSGGIGVSGWDAVSYG